MLHFKMNWARPHGPHSDIVLSSRVRLARNLRGRPFPNRANPKSFQTIRDLIFNAAESCPELSKAARILIDSIDPLDRFFLVERRLISNRLASHPKSRGVLVGDKEVLSLMVNEEDHLRLQGIDSGLCLEDLRASVDKMDDGLAGSLHFAFETKWGYLTACPTNAGTGLRASCLVHLPGLSLTGQLADVLKGLSQLGITARGIYGEGTEALGDFYQLSNTATLGPSQADITSSITRIMAGLLRKETDARADLSTGEQRVRLEDLVYRALGLLAHARAMTFDETMRHLSLVRMGLSLKWKLPADLKTVNELLVLTQPAHIQMLAGKVLDPTDRDFLRATLLRRKFK